MWCDDTSNTELWHKKAREMAQSAGYIKAGQRSDDVYEDRNYMVMFGQFLDERGPLDQWGTGSHALKEWGMWLDDGKDIKPTREHQQFTATITKHYGSVSVTFGYSAFFDVGPGQEAAPYMYCVQMVNSQFQRFEQNGLPQMKPPSSGQDSGGGDFVDFAVDYIEIESKGGKYYAKVFGGQYSRFGVRVWPETLKEADIDMAEVGAGKLDWSGTARAMVVDGKVKKVVKLS